MGSGEEGLSNILNNLQPELLNEDYVFITLDNDSDSENKLDPIATFKEKEGITLVVTQKIAQKNNHQYDSTFSCISLGVHSSLTSVGLIAAISKSLSDNGIACNVFSGYFHDHIFVPNSLSAQAMELINNIKTK